MCSEHHLANRDTARACSGNAVVSLRFAFVSTLRALLDEGACERLSFVPVREVRRVNRCTALQAAEGEHIAAPVFDSVDEPARSVRSPMRLAFGEIEPLANVLNSCSRHHARTPRSKGRCAGNVAGAGSHFGHAALEGSMTNARRVCPHRLHVRCLKSAGELGAGEVRTVERTATQASGEKAAGASSRTRRESASSVSPSSATHRAHAHGERR